MSLMTPPELANQLCNCDVWLFTPFLVTGPCLGLWRSQAPATLSTLLTRHIPQAWLPKQKDDITESPDWCPVQRTLDLQLRKKNKGSDFSSGRKRERAGGEVFAGRQLAGLHPGWESLKQSVSAGGQQAHSTLLISNTLSLPLSPNIYNHYILGLLQGLNELIHEKLFLEALNRCLMVFGF